MLLHSSLQEALPLRLVECLSLNIVSEGGAYRGRQTPIRSKQLLYRAKVSASFVVRGLWESFNRCSPYRLGIVLERCRSDDNDLMRDKVRAGAGMYNHAIPLNLYHRVVLLRSPKISAMMNEQLNTLGTAS